MSVTYTIKVVNNNSTTQQFLLFADVPPVNSDGGQVFTNIFDTAPGVGSGGRAQFVIPPGDFAVCGMASQTLAPGVNVGTANSVSVGLGPNGYGNVTTGINQGGLQFVGAATKSSANGGFAIQDGAWNSGQYPSVFVGHGKQGPGNSGVVPVATWTAAPSVNYVIRPLPIYYISTGQSSAGIIIDVTIGAVAKVDFTAPEAQSKTIATVTMLNDGTYAPTQYSF